MYYGDDREGREREREVVCVLLQYLPSGRRQEAVPAAQVNGDSVHWRGLPQWSLGDGLRLLDGLNF